MILLLEHVHIVLEADQDWSNVFEVVLLKGLELFDGAEKFLEFGDSTTEKIELAENLVGAEVELFGLWHVLETFLSEFVLFNIRFMEIKTGLESSDKFIRRVLLMVPK